MRETKLGGGEPWKTLHLGALSLRGKRSGTMRIAMQFSQSLHRKLLCSKISSADVFQGPCVGVFSKAPRPPLGFHNILQEKELCIAKMRRLLISLVLVVFLAGSVDGSLTSHIVTCKVFVIGGNLVNHFTIR